MKKDRGKDVANFMKRTLRPVSSEQKQKVAETVHRFQEKFKRKKGAALEETGAHGPDAPKIQKPLFPKPKAKAYRDAEQLHLFDKWHRVKVALENSGPQLKTDIRGVPKFLGNLAGKVERGIRTVRSETTAHSRAVENTQEKVKTRTAHEPFRYTRKWGRFLTGEADRLLHSAEATAKRYKETGRWKWQTIRRTQDEVEKGKRKPKAPAPLFSGTKPKETRGYRIPAAKGKRKEFEPIVNVKESKSVGLHGIDWLLDKESAHSPNKAKRVKGSFHLSLPALATGAMAARMEHLRKTNPERYRKERKLTFGAATGVAGAAAGYQAVKAIRNVVKDLRQVKGKLG